jgi:hypothetical protein
MSIFVRPDLAATGDQQWVWNLYETRPFHSLAPPYAATGAAA